MKKIKVAYFTKFIPHYRQDVFEEIGGNKTLTFNVYASYKYKGGFSLINPQKTVNYQFINSKTFKINFFIFSIYFQPKLLICLVKNTFNVYIASLSKSEISVWIGLILSKILNRKMILWGHGSFSNTFSFILIKLMIKLSSGILFYDEKTKDLWIKKGIGANKLFVAHNSVNTNYISKVIDEISPKKVNEFKSTYKVSDTNNIVFSGRLQKRRNLDILFSAMEYIKKKNINIRLLIIGEGPEKEFLYELRSKKDLEKYIIFLGEIYNEYKIAQVFLSSMCAIIPGWVGLLVQHSFCYGLPIIMGDNKSNYGPEASLVINEKTGLICKYNDPKDFANAIIRINNDLKLRECLSENAKQVISTKYNAKNMALDFVKVIKKYGEK